MNSATSSLLEEALLLQRRGDLAGAASRFAQVLRSDPLNADALYYLARTACREGRLAEGIDLVRKSLSVNPGRAAAHHLLGMALQHLGRLQEALESFDAAIAREPGLVHAHGSRGDALLDLGRQAEAVESYDRALQIDPNAVDTWCNRGAALTDLGRHGEALASYERALALKPDFALGHCNRGAALGQLGRHDEALEALDRALAFAPGDPNVLVNRGGILRSLGRNEEALANLARAIAVAPEHVNALLLQGDILRQIGRHAGAIESFNRVLAIARNHADALTGQGASFIELGRYDEALANFTAILAFDPQNLSALNNQGFVLKALDRPDEALKSYNRALEIDPRYAEALNNRAVVLSSLGRQAEALLSCDQALAAAPDHIGTLCNRAKILNLLYRFEEALVATERALAINPSHVQALMVHADTLARLNRHGAAAVSYEHVLKIDPDHVHVHGKLVNSYLANCDFGGSARIMPALHARLVDGSSIVTPLTLLQLDLSPAELLTATKGFVADELQTRSILPRRPMAAHAERIRLAYVSGEFRMHPVTCLIPELLERHDRARFEVIGIGLEPGDGSTLNTRIVAAFDTFHDVTRRSVTDTARLMRELDIDIAIDLSGHTENARLDIFAQRPAAITVSYLGYLGTMAADFIDYVIADKIALPLDQQPFFTEKIVHLPDCFLPNDSKQAIAPRKPARSEVGLPEHGFVFCSFNNSYKIREPVFAIWMRLLRQVDGSVLWLVEANNAIAANLRRAAEQAGVDADRLVFAKRIPLADHLARQRLADLFLDTLPYNVGATGIAALQAGVPFITSIGDRFVGRMGASMLHALGMPELVTNNLAEYEALAMRLATEPGLLASLRAKLERNRPLLPLFDTDRYRRHLEAAYTTMYEIWRRGENPRSFSIDPPSS